MLTDSNSNSRLLFILLVSLVLATTFLRTINLDSDPVPWYTGEDGGYHIDEGYKTLSPRNLFLYGVTHWNNEDQYKGWMKGSAMTQWPYYLSFSAFGENLSSARVVSIIYAVLLLIATALFLWHRLSPKFAVLAFFLLSVESGLFLFSRSALFETSLTFFTYITLFLSISLASRRRWLALVPIIVITPLAFLFLKKTFLLYIVPIVVSFGFISINSKFSPAALKRTTIATLIILALIATQLYFTLDNATGTQIDLAQFLTYPHNIFLNPVHALSPITLIIAYVVIIELLIRQPNSILNDWYILSLAAIVVMIPMMLSFFTFNTPRYHLPVLPAAILLLIERLSMTIPNEKIHSSWFSLSRILTLVAFASLAMAILASINYYILNQLPINFGETPGLSKPGLLKVFPFFIFLFTIATYFLVKRYWFLFSNKLYNGLVALHVIIGIGIIVVALTFPSYEAREIRQQLTKLVKPDESIGGDWAPFFVAHTKLRGLYMRPDRNNIEHLDKLRPDYFLYSSTLYDQKNLNDLHSLNNIRLGTPVMLGEYTDHKISLYSIEYSKPKIDTNFSNKDILN